MKNLISLMTISILSLLISFQASAHFFDSAYECSYTSTSKRTGKTRTNHYYYHPKKNWYLRLGDVKGTSPIKLANLYTPEGRYDGSYKGTHPEPIKVTLGTYWPYKVKRAVKVFSKLNRGDCKPLKDDSIFNYPDLNSLECMDPKGLGTCKAINR